MQVLLAPLGLLFAGVSRARNFFYDHGVFSTSNSSVPLVSVGNLTMGGTGKTPVIGAMVSDLLKMGLRVGVVSRGYKGSYGGVVKVKSGSPAVYGDEPSMLSEKFPDLPIYLGRKRAAAAKAICENENVQIILADDAFQHRQMTRNLDVVVIDAMAPLSDYKPMPWGRAREPLASLSRADFIILTKVNLIEDHKKQEILRWLQPFNKTIVECEYRVESIRRVGGSEVLPFSEPQKFFLVSALGNAEGFHQLVVANGHDVVGSHSFKDHHAYTEEDWQKMAGLAAGAGAAKILVTEKDLVKINEISSLEVPIWSTILTTQFSSEAKQVYEKIVDLVS